MRIPKTMPDSPSQRNPKRIASVILWTVLFAAIVADSNDKLQTVFRLIPMQFMPYLPVFYGVFALAALLLLHSAHQDDLETLRRPDVAPLHEASTRHENKLATLEEQVAETRKRIPAQRRLHK